MLKNKIKSDQKQIFFKIFLNKWNRMHFEDRFVITKPEGHFASNGVITFPE